MEALTILILSGAGLILLVAYLIFRIGTYRKRSSIEDSAREISDLKSEKKVSERRVDPHIEIPVIPEAELLIILYKGNRKPWMNVMKEKLSEGRRVVVVSSKDPSSQRSSFRGDSHFIWLNRSTAHEEADDLTVVNPTNLSSLLREITASIERDGIILFKGFEDLLQANESSRILRFLQMLDDECGSGGFSSIIPAPYKALPQRTRVQLTENFETVVI
jgi:hypothetical protein